MKKGFRQKYRPDFPADYVFEYKDPVSLGRFIAEGGKIVPARISKVSHYQQRQVTTAVKRARSLGLLPQGMDAHDKNSRQEPISPKPFEF